MSDCKKDCACIVCQAEKEGLNHDEILQRITDMQKERLSNHGYYVHVVFDDKGSINAHTHGLENFDHLNFQVVVPLPENVLNGIFVGLVDLVKSGEKFKHNQKVDGVIKNYQVKLFKTKEDGRDVLRVILPDPDGNLDINKIHKKYSYQYPKDENWKWPVNLNN